MIRFDDVLMAMRSLLDTNVLGEQALDLAFFFTVMQLFDYKLSVDLARVSQLFRPDFKVYLVNAKLAHIGGCPPIALEDTSSFNFAAIYICLAGTLFTDLDDIIDAELHALIKCVPSIIAGNSQDIKPQDIESFIADEASQLSLEQLQSKVDIELELASNLAKRRINVVKKVKELHPEIAEDPWSAVSANLDLGDRLDQFKAMVESKKKALAMMEIELWNKIAELESPQGLPVEFPPQDSSDVDAIILDLLTQGASPVAQYVPEEMSAAMSKVKRQLVAEDLNRVKQILSFVEDGITQELARVEQTAARFDAKAEYLLIKLFFKPVVAASQGTEDSVSCSESQGLMERQLLEVASETTKLRNMLESNLFLPQIEHLKQMNLKVVLK